MVLGLASPALAAAPQDTYSWVKNIGTSGCPVEERQGSPAQYTESYGKGVVVKNGKVYFSATGRYEVWVFNADGTNAFKFGGYGNGSGEFLGISGIAVDSNDNIYVYDHGNYRIQKFDSSGDYISQFGTQGSGDGELNTGNDQNGIAISPANGNIYVTDSGNQRIQVFSPSGTYLSQFNETIGSSGGQQLSSPKGLVFDSSGNVNVADAYNHRIVKFDANGNYISDFGSYGSGDGELNVPTALTIDSSSGDVYVTDTRNYRVQKFSSTGVYLSQFGSQGSGDGQFGWGPAGIALDSTGNIYVADGGHWPSGLQKFDTAGTFISNIQWEASPAIPPTPASDPAGPSGLCQPWGIARDSGGNIYVVNQGRSRVNKYSSSGAFIGTIGANWDGQSEPTLGVLTIPFGIAIDSKDNIYITDYYMGIQKFDQGGNFITNIGNTGIINGRQYIQFGIAIDAADNIYVTNSDMGDGQVASVTKYDASGNTLFEFGSVGTDNGQFTIPYGIAIDTHGNSYVTDVDFASGGGAGRVQKFDSNGNYLSQFGSPGTGDGQFSAPIGITIDASSNIFVTDIDPENGSVARVQKFDSNGNYLSQFGLAGTDDDQFIFPVGVVTDPNGNVYVTNFNAGRGNEKISVWHAPVPPSAPQQVAATTNANTPTELTVSWQAPAHGTPTSYTVRYRAQGTTQWHTVTVAGNALATTLTGLTPNTTYDIEVLAVNNIGTSPAGTTTGTTGTTAGPTVTTPIAPNSGFAKQVAPWVAGIVAAVCASLMAAAAVRRLVRTRS